MSAGPRARVGLGAALCAIALVAGATVPVGSDVRSGAASPRRPEASADRPAPGHARGAGGPHGTVTLAFAGDTHFQLQLAALLDHPRGALGPMAGPLAAADLTMVNLESAVAEGGTPDPKELEEPADRYWYRTSPRALVVLERAGVDVVTMANNHGADYGAAGLAETLRARRDGPVAVVGAGRNRRDAFSPYRVSVRGTDFAFLGADASAREGSSSVWAAGPRTPGLAAAHAARPRALLAAVRAADRHADVVVVYLHWGEEERGCPTHRQTVTARALAGAGADVVVGSHAHVLLGSGWLGDTYVDYGLGNFVWYHDHHPETGVLRLEVRDGRVVGDTWIPARIRSWGRPYPLRGADRAAASADWRRLRDCTGLAAVHLPLADHVVPGDGPAPLPAYSWSGRRIGPGLLGRLRFSHRPGCPVAVGELRYARMTYLGFDGHAHTGELVVHRHYLHQVVMVFRQLYDARWPIRRMRLVDDFGGEDQRSMAADNTSAFNCRRVAGSRSWSAHAYGAAIDVNPVQNPDLTGARVAPPAGRRFATIRRSPGAHPPPGVITADGPVVRAFARIGWEWGGRWSTGRDYQHFAAPELPGRSRGYDPAVTTP
ncbi:CapA family protein [Nocardioides sp. MAHUQ-72]|uniref:CapA family protein n=1 Tax=unclassified Nocardioides TaxID=2615069 RepID=UPI00360D2B42